MEKRSDIVEGRGRGEVGEFALNSFFNTADEVDTAEWSGEVGSRWIQRAILIESFDVRGHAR